MEAQRHIGYESDVQNSTPMGPMAGYAAVAAEAKRTAAAIEADRLEAIKTLEKDSFNLGDLNPLIHPLDLTRKESVEAIKHVIMNNIRTNNGLEPVIMESALVTDPNMEQSALRFVTRFEVKRPKKRQIQLLEELVADTYDAATVRTRTDSKGNDIPLESYPPIQMGEEMRSKTSGWFMGVGPVPTSPLYEGLYVFKDLGKVTKDNFLEKTDGRSKFIIEIREGSLEQADLVTFITQVSAILGKDQKMPDKGQLLYESYYALMRLGLKSAGRVKVHGLDTAIDQIKRELIKPLASPDLSRGIREDPQSVLLVGVPGTGKTLIVESLLQEETGVFIVPLDPFALQTELSLPKQKQTLLARIAKVGRITGKKVVLHVDDIENMVDQQAVTNSTMLNLMAGVQESGFYIIASTNFPYRINGQLIQPQRFSVLIHCALQDEAARYEILKIHADMESQKLGKPLFASDEHRDIILRPAAMHSDGFSPRYLANIATIAKSHLMKRVTDRHQQTIGLTEDHLEGVLFEVEDWDKAFQEVDSKYDSQTAKHNDKEMREFVVKNTRAGSGFGAFESGPRRVFSGEVYERALAAVAHLDLESPEARA